MAYGKVERSHREVGKIVYNRKIFTREKDLIKQFISIKIDITIQLKYH